LRQRLSPDKTSAASLAPVAVDDILAERTAGALLRRGDAFTVNYIEREARATADAVKLSDADRDKILNRFRSSAGLSVDDKKLLIDLSPDVCRELGIDLRKFALWTALGVIGLHGLNIWQCVQELKDMRRSIPTPPPAPANAEADARPVPIRTGTVPVPKREVETAPQPMMDPAGQKLVEFPKT
jgi:hypothetical protein